MSRPSLHKSFAIDSGTGFVDILYGKTTITGELQNSPFANLHLLPLGYKCESLPSPFTLESFQDFLGYVTEQYDLTIIDTEPVLQSSHAQYIASRTDGVVVIAEAGKSRLDDLIEMKTQLQNDGVHLIGSFLNRQRRIIPRWVTRFI
ncbi:MAG: hypothetical protein D3905_06820 [Candidatus Electrothrix sp. AS4_5]|nr:hypothetical protein [Candidatus Electrothrix gigas]